MFLSSLGSMKGSLDSASAMNSAIVAAGTPGSPT
jgi:hypothetical protein